MGIGMTIVTSAKDAPAVVKKTRGRIIGGIVKGGGAVRLIF
jgi:hypothetical protein